MRLVSCLFEQMRISIFLLNIIKTNMFCFFRCNGHEQIDKMAILSITITCSPKYIFPLIDCKS